VGVAAAAALLVCAGCGARHAEQRVVVRQPRLPAALASQLANRSASVAATLEDGDGCAALRLARELQRQTIEAINTGRIPAAFQEPLQSSVNDIAGRIRCVVPAPPRPKPKEKSKGKRHRKHEHGDEGD
jgi:hypothetical protein